MRELERDRERDRESERGTESERVRERRSTTATIRWFIKTRPLQPAVVPSAAHDGT